MSTKHPIDEKHRNPDPITDAPGSHPVGTGIGAVAGGAIAGAAIGSMAGPVGTAVGAAIGAIAGGMAGHAVAESVHPTTAGAEPAAGVFGVDPGPPADIAVPDTYDIGGTQAPIEVDHQTVAVRAYDIWERKGHTEGHALDDWLQAEAVVRASV